MSAELTEQPEMPDMTAAQYVMLGVQLAPVLARNARRLVDAVQNGAEPTDAEIAEAMAGSDEALVRLKAAAERQQARRSGVSDAQ
jgi:hypothetical protein